MSTPSADTPRSDPSDLPSEKTQVAPYPWMRRHMGQVAAVAPVLTAAVSWGVGVLGGLDPVKAFGQLGAPMGFVVLLVMALVWTYTVHIPRQAEAAEKTRQAQLKDAADDRALFRETMTEQASAMKEIAAEVKALAAEVRATKARTEAIARAMRMSGSHDVLTPDPDLLADETDTGRYRRIGR